MTEVDKISNMIRPAERYKPVDDLWVITSFFNSLNYITKYNNYIVFIESLERSGINYLVVECAFKDQPFTLPDSPNIIKVRAQSILWQKERLLNFATTHLPKTCTKVAWIDCDVLFENELWASKTSDLLEQYAIVQPFDYAIRLPKGADHYQGDGEHYESFASIQQKSPADKPIGDYTLHGHTGFAWAARRSFIEEYGLYDPCLSGSSDHLMVHAFTGDYDSPCVKMMLGDNDFTYAHFLEWAQAVYPIVSGKVISVPGTLLHLWHGDTVNRQYLKKNKDIAKFKFNPKLDVSLNSEGCWEWSRHGRTKHDLINWAIEFDSSRKEDG